MQTLVGQTIGRYQILIKISETGSGSVYRAHDVETDCKVLFRLLPPSINGSSDNLERIRQSIFINNEIDHPNIAKIIDVGLFSGSIYIISEYIPKGSLLPRMNKKIPWKKAAKIIASLARTIEYAHKKKICHGDLKPTNILFREDGTPVIVDFGLRRVIESLQKENLLGTWLGYPDPDYVAPDQILSDKDQVFFDIYSLGVIFYEMITGRRMYQGDEPIITILEKIQNPISSYKVIIKKFPQKVGEILYHSLSPKSTEQYKTMGEFARKLEQLAYGKVLEEPATGTPYMQQRSNRRIAVYCLGILVSFVLIGSIFGVLQQKSINQEGQENVILITKTTSPKPSIAITNQSLSSSSDLTQTTLDVETFPTTSPVQKEALSQYPSLLGTPLPTNLQIISKENAPRIVPLAVWGMGKLTKLIWSPDGKYQAVGSSTGIHIISTDLQVIIAYINIGSTINDLDYSDDGKLLAVGSSDGLVQVLSTQSWTELYSFGGYAKGVNAIQLSSDSKYLAATSENNNIKIWDLESGKELYLFEGHALTINCIEFSPDNMFIATGSDDLTVKIWSLTHGSLIKSLPNPGKIMDMDFSSDGRLLLVGGGGNQVTVWNMTSEDPIYVLPGYNDVITSVSFSLNNQSIITSDSSGNVWAWNYDSPGGWKTIWRVKSSGLGKILDIQNYKYITSVSYSPDGLMISIGNWDGTIDYLDPKTGEIQASLTKYSMIADRVVFSEDNRFLAIQTLHKNIKLIDLQDAKVTQTIPGVLPKGHPFSNHNDLLAVQTDSQTITLWNIQSKQVIRTLGGHSDIKGIYFSPDGIYLIVLHGDNIKVWSMGSFQEIRILNKKENLCAVAYLMNETQLAYASPLAIPGMWGQDAGYLCALSKPDWVVSFDRLEDKKLLAYGGSSLVRIWNYSTSTGFDQTLKGMNGLVPLDLDLSVNGAVITGGMSDATIKIWDVESGNLIISLIGHQLPATSVDFSPTNHLLVSSSLDGTVRMWGVK
ncbi:MAG TPA: protein kinase [Anaerolineaceae bacterium]|nr:protein kinase [Anaerolineaceae bacterium]